MTYAIPYVCMCCGACMERCPTGAISPRNGYYEVDPQLCIECGVCSETCPYDYPFHVGMSIREPRQRRTFAIVEDKCIGCSVCARACPAQAIEGQVKQPYTIHAEQCIGCGLCMKKCRKDAVTFDGPALPDLPLSIDVETCVSCDLCRKHCPCGAIEGSLIPKFVVDYYGVYKVPYYIDPQACTRCETCVYWCPQGAIAPAGQEEVERRHQVVLAKREQVPVAGNEHVTGVL